jgi:uncharacterized YkwD family protein
MDKEVWYMKKFLSIVTVLFLLLTSVQTAEACSNTNVSNTTAKKTQVKCITKLDNAYKCYTIPWENITVKNRDSSCYPIIKVYKVSPKAPSKEVPAPEKPAPAPEKPAPKKPAPEPKDPVSPPAEKPEPQPQPEPSPGFEANAMQAEMLSYINAERAKANLSPLVLDKKLCEGAYLKSQDMAKNGYFSHNSPTYGSPFDMMKSLGITYRTAGENIAKNTSVKGAHDAFMNSSGHRANILGQGYNKVGLGFYQEGRYLFVTQWFTN